MDRAYRLYRRYTRRCRTENQFNRVHIALDNYMTPAEVRHFAAALASEAAESPSRRWIATLERSMPVKAARPVEFERREHLKGVTHYTASAFPAAEKTLILGFSGIHHRLMMPTAWWLDCLNPRFYDVVILRDFSRRSFASGLPGLGKDLLEALSGLWKYCDPRAYRKSVAIGSSAGGVPGIIAAIALKLDRGIALCASHYLWYAEQVKALGLNEPAFAAVLASRPRPFPELILVSGADKKDDLAAAIALHAVVPSQLWKVRNCAQHGVLKWHLERGTLRAFIAKILDQSLEASEPPGARLAARWIFRHGGLPQRRPGVPPPTDSVSSD
jgi:hypothetical protein